MNRINLYSSDIANSTDVVRKGFAALIQAAEASGKNTAWLICHTKGSLDGIISEVIGPDAAAALSKGKSVRLPLSGSRSLVFFHSRSLPPFSDGSPILVCYPDRALLQRVDEFADAFTLIVLPWDMDEIRPWLLSHGAVDILGKVNALPSVIANQVVQAAVGELLASINVSSGVTHPSDRDAAIGTFRVLRTAGEQYDPEQVAAWFVQNGMAPRHAADVAAIASNPGRCRFSRHAFKKGTADLARWRAKT